MDLQGFIEKVAEQYEDVDDVVFKPETEYKKLSQWSSITALSIIAMIDEEYGITIKGNDIQNSGTLEELYKVCTGK